MKWAKAIIKLKGLLFLYVNYTAAAGCEPLKAADYWPISALRICGDLIFVILKIKPNMCSSML